MRINKILLLVLFVLVLASLNVAAENQNVTQENITTVLSIYDVPSLGTVTLDDSDPAPANEIDPAPGTTTEITCQAVATDLDGDTDIASAEATFYHTSVGSAAVDDDLNHYYDATCTVTTGTVDNDADINCSVDIEFYAEHGAWNCNITVYDSQSLNTSAVDPSGATVTDLLALAVTAGNLDFGQLAIGADTGSTDFTRTITNNGNVNLSVDLNVWGGSINDAHSMDCSTGHTIPGDMRVATSAAVAYATKTQLTSDAGTGANIAGFAVNHAVSGAVGTTGILYFGMGVSASGSPTETCSGEMMITANEV